MSQRYRRLFRARLTTTDPRDLDEEFHFHLQMRARELESLGVAPAQAREMAAAEFGDIDDARRFCQAEDEHRMRRYRRGLWMDHLLQDLRYAARSLRAARLTTFIAIACIAIGVGANLAIFTVVRGVLLRPLPFGDPASLVRLGETEHGNGPFYFSPANYLDVATLRQAFTVALWRYVDGDLATSGGGAPRRIAGVRSSGNLMTVLRARAAVGRVFDDRDTLLSAPVVVISDQLWRSEFGADRAIVGRSISIGGLPYTILGVMPPEFNFPIETERRDYWTPDRFSAGFGNLQNRMNHTAQVVGRLTDETDIARARVYLDELGRRLARAFPDQQGARGFSIESLYDATVVDVRRPLLLVMGAVGLVFLIACANMASVLLARGMARRREVTIRTALGATRLRLVRQLMTECLLLAACGAVAGIATARLALSLLLALAEQSLPRLDAISFDGSTVAIGIVVSAAIVLVVSLMPALQATRVDLRIGMTGDSGERSGRRLPALQTLIGIEAALALLLLVGAGLLIRSFAAIVALDPGFETTNRLTFRVAPPSRVALADSLRYARFFGPAIEQIRNLPGVTAVGATSLLPIQDGTNDSFFFIDGVPRSKDMSTWPDAQVRTVAGDYFRAMGMRLRAGRFFDASDNATSTPVVVVNEELVRRFFDGRNPVGRRLDPGSGVMSTVVGVVGSTRQLIESPPMPELYTLGAQNPRATGSLTFVVSTSGDPYGVLAPVRTIFRQLAPTQALFLVGTLDAVIPESLRARKLVLSLLGIFAALAMGLSGAGVYGVTSYAVSRRTREIGIRMALGADSGRVMRMILSEVLRVVAIGAAFGLAAAIAGSSVIRSLLFGVQPIDPPSLMVAVAIVLAAGVVAALLPARRASGISATVAIKSD